MLTTLRLQNFKKHDDLTVEFGAGVTAVTGPNFAGKSSVLDGIAFALWGPKAVAGGMDVCLKRGQDTLAVSLGFTLGEKAYTVRRTKTTATLFEGDQVIAKSASAVTAKLRELLGLNQLRFTQLKLAQQKKTEALLTAGVTELHQIIEEVSGADVVSRILNRATDRVRKAEAGLEVLPEVDMAGTEDRVKEVRKALRETTAAEEAAAKHRATQQAVVAEAELELTQAVKHNEGVASRQKEAASVEAALAACARQTEKLEADLPALRKAATEAVDSGDITRLQEAVRVARSQLDKHWVLQQAVDAAQKEAQAAAVALSHAEQALEALGEAVPMEKVERQRQRVDRVRADVVTREWEVKRLRSAIEDAVCPTCKRPFEDHDPEQLQGELDGGQQALTVAQSQLRDSQDVLQRLKQVFDKQQAGAVARDRARELQLDAGGRLKRARGQLAVLGKVPTEAEVAQLESKLDALRTERERSAQVQAELFRTERQLEALRTEHTKWQEEREALPEAGEAILLGPLNEEAALQRKRLRDADDALSLHKVQRTELSATLRNLEQELFHMEQQQTRRRALEEQQKMAKQLVKYLRDNRDRFVGEVWGGVTAYASQFAAACTGGALQQVQRGEDGAFTYLEDGDTLPVEAASGAQRSIMGLGIQLALDQLLPSQLHVLLLDEPTADMAPDISMAATAQLQGLGSQVVMITHRELDGSVAEQVVNL